MPHIKTAFGMRAGVKVFHEDGVCWKCGKSIPVGTFNWSYNTHAVGKYSHKDCSAPAMQDDSQDATQSTQSPTQSNPQSNPAMESKPQQSNAQAKAFEALAAAQALLKEQLKTGTLPTLPVQTPIAKPVQEWIAPEIPDHHKQYDLLRRVLINHPKRSVYLAGSPGAGKSFAIRTLANEMKLPYYCQPLCETSSVSDLLGYFDAHSNLVRTMFREAYEHGGFIDLPELDNTDPNLLTTLNNAIDNDECGFSDGMVKRHPKCFIIANGNTDLRGPTPQFPGRRKQDAATVERFAFIPWKYDEHFERAFYPKSKADADFVTLIQKIRKHCLDAGIEIVVSQRAIRDGIAMLNSGFNIDDAMALTLFKEHPQTEEIYLAIGRPFPKVSN